MTTVLPLVMSIFLVQLQAVEKFPEGLLTPDYGIITKDDLAINSWRTGVSPRNINSLQGGLYFWQCFPVKEAKPRVHTWQGPDGMSPSDLNFTMCSLEIRVERPGDVQIFGERRAYRVDRCRDFMKQWRKLTQGESYVCLNGEGGDFTENAEKGLEKPVMHWVWDQIKTAKGCHSYFGSECDFSYWKRRGYPGPKPSQTPARVK